MWYKVSQISSQCDGARQNKMWDGVNIRESYYLSQIKACKEIKIERGTRFEDKVEEDLSFLKIENLLKKIRNLIRD